MPLLSVHLITYNNEKHIEETIQSILKQKVDFEYEIVVGDDCSTDDTLDIIRNLSELNPGVFKIHKNEPTKHHPNSPRTVRNPSERSICQRSGTSIRIRMRSSVQRKFDSDFRLARLAVVRAGVCG